VILLAGTVIKLTGYALYVAYPAENIPEDAINITDHEDSSTGGERLFADYVKRSAGHAPLFTGSVNFLTDHA
jgi:hypothetical protein